MTRWWYLPRILGTLILHILSKKINHENTEFEQEQYYKGIYAFVVYFSVTMSLYSDQKYLGRYGYGTRDCMLRQSFCYRSLYNSSLQCYLYLRHSWNAPGGKKKWDATSNIKKLRVNGEGRLMLRRSPGWGCWVWVPRYHAQSSGFKTECYGVLL